MLQQNFTTVSELLRSINASVIHDLEVIAMFDGTVNGTGVMDVQTRLQNITMIVSNLNTSSNNSFQTLQQTLVKADSLQNDFDDARDNITESLIRINGTMQLLSIAENLINSTTIQNSENRDNLSLLSADIQVQQNDLRLQLNRTQSYGAQLNSTYIRAMTLWNTLTQTEQEAQNSSITIEQLHNYSNVSLDLTTYVMAALQELNVRNIVKLYLYVKFYYLTGKC